MAKKKVDKLVIGGQAVIEGVMIKSPKYYSVAVRKPNMRITVKKEKLKSIFSTKKIFQKPFLRGIAQLIEMLVLGIKTLTYSANESMDEEEEKLSAWGIFWTIFIAFGMAVLLFILLPLYLSGFITTSDGFMFNLIDGVIRILVFLLYILAISKMQDVKTLFQYHGAEHKTIHAYEKGLSLNVKNVKKFSTLHTRCGTSFILIVLVVSILVFSLIVSESFLVKLGVRILLLPIIAGVSYEFLKFSAKYEHNVLLKPLIYPGLFFQKITTKEPTDNQLEVAIKAVKEVLKLEKVKI
ncbi:DUF1385 domain-containing protein [Candidatus Woesearchaeota archaeon]|nr:DUF1385 domain-containing protein [Candidatus Woesearchaeota archaeon]